ncbi:MAG: xanthine dehydrogenase family protein molybdopterin-binding subunit [Desulforhopalus sp.]
MSEGIDVNRRDFLKIAVALGGGLVLGVYLPGRGEAGATKAGTAEPFVPNAFIRIDTDDTVTIFVNKSEMGQGVYTSLPMLIAEELEADWTKMKVEPAPVDPAYNHTMFGPIMVTGGSTSIRSEWERLRTAGAAARIMLISAAAEKWRVEPLTCRAENGYIVHRESKQRISYGQLVKPAAQQQPPGEIALKSARDWTIIGRDRARLDIPEKTNGTALFGIDVTVPGMLAALVARPPVFGATMKSFDDIEAMKIPGVKAVVAIDRGVAVVADGFWNASRGRDALKVVWDEGPLAALDSEEQGAEYAEMAKKPGLVAARRGDAIEAMAKAATKIEAVYELPYLAHAPMEPLNCVADVRPDGCDIWTGTQMQTTDRDRAAAITGLAPEQVMLHNTYLGGGFGRRAVQDAHFVAEAVQISQQVKAPVKVYWTREDDIRGGYYRPRSYNLIAAGLGEDGMPVAWQHRIVGQSIIAGTPFESGLMQDGIDGTSVEGAVDSPYDVENFLVDYHMAPAGIPVLWWRSVGHSYTAYVVECFIDELAKAAGKDPYQYRRGLLAKHPRERGVLDLVAEKAGWSENIADGRGRGIAVHASFGSYVAQVAEVSVEESGRIRVHKVTCAVDCGRTVNPDTIIAQMESGIVFGLSAALYGEITFNKGRVYQGNFDDYEVLRMDGMPEVEVYIVPSEEPPGGVGEPGVPPIAPAVANGVMAITGKPIRRLPLSLKRVREAMQAT